MKLDNSKLFPSGWAVALIGELVAPDGIFIDGDWVETKDQDPNGQVRLVQLADVGDGAYRDRSSRFLTHKKALELGCTFLVPGDVLIARMPDPLGRACIFPGDRKAAVTVVDVCIVRTGRLGVNHKWLAWAINSPQFRSEIASLQSGSTRKRISRGNLAKLHLPVPPSTEQQRIVAEIEKQLTRLDAAVAALNRVQANLKRYRAAVLKSACEGRLVPTEAELARREGRPHEPAGSGGIPIGWRASTIQESVKIIDYRGRTPPFSESGIPHLRSSNIRGGKVVWNGLAYVSEGTYEKYMTRGLPQPGDILFTTEAPLGEVAPVPTDRRFSVAQRIMILRPRAEDLDSRFLMYQIMSPRFQAVLYGKGTGTTVTGVSSRNFRPAQISIPPLSEQQHIADEIERRLSIIDDLEMQAEADLMRAASLSQAILKRAFEGQLVPQDPSDEPASVLLERIRSTATLACPEPRRRARPEERRGRATGKQK